MANPRKRHWFTWLIVLTAVVATAVFAHVGWRLIRDGGATASFGWSETSHGGVSYVASVVPEGEASAALRPLRANPSLHPPQPAPSDGVVHR